MRSFHRAAAVKHFVLFLILAALISSAGCMSTPHVGPAFQYYRSRQASLATECLHQKPFTSPAVEAAVASLKQDPRDADNLEHRMAMEEAISGHPFVAGNRVTLLVNRPAAYNAMFKMIRDAKKSVNIETYTLSNDRAGYAFANLLIEKAAEGVHVNLIYDSIGSICSSPAFFQRLTDAGVKVLPFNPITPLSGLPLRGGCSGDHRDHRKLVVVDDSVAFVGSANISDVCGTTGGVFPGTTGDRLPWRDTDVEIEGPVVPIFDAGIREHRPDIADNSHLQPPKPQGNDLVMAVGSTWGKTKRDNYFLYLNAINSARRSIALTCSYFIPDKHTLDALIAAARRGVDVKIILPHKSDSTLALYGGRNYYGRLLKAGVKLYERRGVILHAKTGVIDGVWSTVGSDNMDYWSILRNNELNAVILSRSFAKKMETLFEYDRKHSDRITLEKWEHRSALERLLELFTYPMTYWL